MSANANLGANSSALSFNGGTLASTGTYTLAHAVSVLSGGATMNVSSGNTVTLGSSGFTAVSGATFTQSGTGTLTFNASLDLSGLTYNLGGGTLALNNISLSLGTLHITADSIIDFGSGSSTLSIGTFIIDTGVTLTVKNWANMADYFLAQNWTGAQSNVRGQTPMNQVVFTGYNGSVTAWTPYNSTSQITPVPEPSTYGAFFSWEWLEPSFSGENAAAARIRQTHHLIQG